MGCHDEGSKRPLLLGGTLYPISNGSREPQPLDDCFGIEGVQVTVTDANGRERSTVTNRAGNFYFEGRPSEFPMPYTASIRWYNLEGEERLTPMFAAPSYGGCARCHDAAAVRFPELPLYGNPPTVPDADVVSPAGSVIYLPGLYP
jgi:hypothetical protein